MSSPSTDPQSLQQIVADASIEDGPSVDEFDAFLRARSGDPTEMKFLADLYLVCACISGSASAKSRLGEELLAVSIASRSVRVPDSTVDDARQIVFERLVAPRDGALRIASYDGRGPLRGWLRVVLAREALALHKQRADKSHGTDWVDALANVVAPQDDPELAAVKTELCTHVRQALKTAARALPANERMLLRQHLVLGMNVDALAPVYGIHRATVARRILSAKDALIERFFAEAASLTGYRKAEVASLRTLIQSRLDMSLASVLATIDGSKTGHFDV